LILRKIKREDLVFVNEIRNDESTRNRLKNPEKISIEKTYEWFDKSDPGWFIIEVKNTPIGYIRTSSDTGETICIGCDIHPDHRRQGYARKAYESYIPKLYQNGYIIVWLEVFDDNFPAKKLYESLGFEKIGSRLVNNKEYLAMVHKRDT